MTDLSNLLIIEYGIEDFAEDHPDLTPDQLKEVISRLSSEMDYSIIDEHIHSEFYDMAQSMFPDVFIDRALDEIEDEEA